MQLATVEQALQNVSGGSFVGIDTLTDVKLTGGKKNPHQGRVTKSMTGAQVMVFQNKNINGYEAMIRRRLEAEGKDPATFVLGERAWGQRLPNSPIVVHKKEDGTRYYLEVIFLRAGGGRIPPGWQTDCCKCNPGVACSGPGPQCAGWSG